MWFHSEAGQLPEGSCIAEWQRHLDDASQSFGKRLNVAGSMGTWMLDAGFQNVNDDILKVPIGSWPRDRRLKEQGQWLQAQMLDSIEPISLAYFTRILKWSEVRTQVFIAAVRKEFMNNSLHLFVYCHIVYGKRA